MESSSSIIPKQGKNPSEIINYEELLRSFRNFGLKTDASDHNTNASCYSSGFCSTQTLQEYSPNGLNLDHIKSQQWFLGQGMSKNSVSDHDSIWDFDFLGHEGDSSFGTKKTSVPNLHDHSGCSFIDSINQKDWNLGLRTPYDFRPSTSNFTNLDKLTNQSTSVAGLDMDSMLIQDILKGRRCLQKERLINALQKCFFTLMIDEQMSSIFETLLDACKGHHLDSLIVTIVWESELFIKATFYKQGVTSIVKLIRKVKKSNHAFIVTKILSTKLFDIMTNRIAREVIQKCFIFLGHMPNEILYEKTIQHCRDLAMNKQGCRSLYDCISTIAGEQRMRLLNYIADISDELSIDDYGNYVVQHVLDLKNKNVTARIFRVLQGHLIRLAQNKVGSNVVENCMKCSELGLVVVTEISRDPRILFVLAQHQFGNYVIQKALQTTKEYGYVNLYNSLVTSLRPFYEALNRTTGGRNVIKCIDA